jgi:hypothetical protein
MGLQCSAFEELIVSLVHWSETCAPSTEADTACRLPVR